MKELPNTDILSGLNGITYGMMNTVLISPELKK
jgi:hypothetical protein